MWNMKKGQTELLCRTETDSDVEKLTGFDGGQVAEGWAGGLGEKCKTGL